jgi:glyoxylase-like metal-dependent hydrolase (beta-lactamase superfamily II)
VADIRATKETSRKPAAKTPRKARATAPSKSAPVAHNAARKVSPNAAPQATPAGKQPSAAGGTGNIRVRMYRVGFGDLFLLTVPGKHDPAHILIDCGVHAKDLKTIGNCVQNMKKETGNRLALVILTHYHADHMSGFASNYDDFAAIEVGAVWITNRLDPTNHAASRIHGADHFSRATIQDSA